MFGLFLLTLIRIMLTKIIITVTHNYDITGSVRKNYPKKHAYLAMAAKCKQKSTTN